MDSEIDPEDISEMTAQITERFSRYIGEELPENLIEDIRTIIEAYA